MNMRTLVIIIKNRKNKNENSGYEHEISEIKSLIKTYSPYSDFYEILLRIDSPNPSLYIGSGKVQDLKQIIIENKIVLAVLNITLNQTQQRNLREIWGIDVMDKTFLILEIFNQRAKSQEGKLQVELARLRYELSRISHKGISFDQQYGVKGIRGGSGERKIEYERRVLRDRISILNSKIETIKKTREIQRKKRKRIPLPIISIVGYTNAGKSTLLNSLSKKNDIYADNMLFSTLDPTSRRVMIKKGFFAIFTDTVGFINNLPTLLISAFSATLEEIKYSDLIIHLHDLTSDIEKNNIVVKKTLKEITADNIPLINVFNKMDAVKNINRFKVTFSNLNPVFISAREKIGFEDLFKTIDLELSKKWKERIIEISNNNFNLINEIKKDYFVIEERYYKEAAIIKVKVTDENYDKITDLIKTSPK